MRLDVYAVGNQEAYNLEMQATDTNELPDSMTGHTNSFLLPKTMIKYLMKSKKPF